MASSLTDDLVSQLQGQPLTQISQQLGLSPADAQSAVATALPLLLGALGRNTSQPQGADSLFGALQRDHTGLDLGNVLGTVLGGGGQGSQILGHILGQREQVAAQGLGAATGLGGDRAGMLLKILAPIVMAYLAKRMFASREVAGPSAPNSTPTGLSEVLGQENTRLRQQSGTTGGLLSAVLDRDGDGDVDFSDITRIGGSIFGEKRV